jgi:hypothetical protein
MDKHSEYVARMETQMKKWDADVDALTARGELAGAEARSAYHKQIQVLRAGRDSAHKTFQEMRLASESAGAKMKANMEVAWETMQKALAKVSADLRK